MPRKARIDAPGALQHIIIRGSGIRVKGDERILGSSDFVEAVLKQSNEDLQEKYRLAATGPNFETLLRKVARYYRIDPDD